MSIDCWVSPETFGPNCIFEPYWNTPAIGESGLAMFLLVALAAPLYARTGDASFTAVVLSMFSGIGYAVAPPAVANIMFMCVFFSVASLVFTIFYRTVVQ